MNVKDPPTEYIHLETLIDFDTFDYDHWRTHEITKLQPQLEYLGYSDIVWSMGEVDSFGPLIRVCKAKDRNGQVIHFIYG